MIGLFGAQTGGLPRLHITLLRPASIGPCITARFNCVKRRTRQPAATPVPPSPVQYTCRVCRNGAHHRASSPSSCSCCRRNATTCIPASQRQLACIKRQLAAQETIPAARRRKGAAHAHTSPASRRARLPAWLLRRAGTQTRGLLSRRALTSSRRCSSSSQCIGPLPCSNWAARLLIEGTCSCSMRDTSHNVHPLCMLTVLVVVQTF